MSLSYMLLCGSTHFCVLLVIDEVYIRWYLHTSLCTAINERVRMHNMHI